MREEECIESEFQQLYRNFDVFTEAYVTLLALASPFFRIEWSGVTS
jgi:hypothetical protein